MIKTCTECEQAVDTLMVTCVPVDRLLTEAQLMKHEKDMYTV